jgi:hypothetical protein
MDSQLIESTKGSSVHWPDGGCAFRTSAGCHDVATISRSESLCRSGRVGRGSTRVDECCTSDQTNHEYIGGKFQAGADSEVPIEIEDCRV